MRCHLWKDPQREAKLSLSHRLDYELSIVTEEKEASTATGSFSCLEHHVTVEFGTQALVQNFKTREVVFKGTHKGRHSVESYLDICLDDKCLLLYFLAIPRHRASLPLFQVLHFDLGKAQAGISSGIVHLKRRRGLLLGGREKTTVKFALTNVAKLSDALQNDVD